jgi:hypothetical protein
MWTVFVEGNSTSCQTYEAMPLQLFEEINHFDTYLSEATAKIW